MENFIILMKKILLDLFFPKFCLNCNCKGSYICQDCLALIDISSRVLYPANYLSRLYFAADYENFIIKNLIRKFKYKPFVKDLAKTLALFIIIYLQNLENPAQFFQANQDFILASIPLFKKRLKWRGFNQAEEIAKQLSLFLNLPFNNNILLKIRKTRLQTDLAQNERKQNIKNAFVCQNKELIKNKNIILVDDVYTTGSTMNEAAKTLKQSGAKKIWGIVVARR